MLGGLRRFSLHSSHHPFIPPLVCVCLFSSVSFSISLLSRGDARREADHVASLLFLAVLFRDIVVVVIVVAVLTFVGFWIVGSLQLVYFQR